MTSIALEHGAKKEMWAAAAWLSLAPTVAAAPPDRTRPPKQRADDDWPNATLRSVQDEIGGMKLVIRLPQELQEVLDYHTPRSREWQFPDEPYVQPSFRVRVGPRFPASVEEAVNYLHPNTGNQVVRKELVGDRFTLIYKSKTYVVAEVIVRVGDKSLECRGTRTSPTGFTNADALGAWLAAV